MRVGCFRHTTVIFTQNALLGYNMRALLLQQGFSIVAERLDTVSENFAIHNSISFVWKGGGEKFGQLYVQSLSPEWLVTYAKGLCKLG
jgi:hypothetical protein